MRRLLMISGMTVGLIACWVVPGTAQVPADTPADSSASPAVSGRALIPVRVTMPEGGVRIRSVHGKQPIIIIRTPPWRSGSVFAQGIPPSPVRLQPPGAAGLTQTDLDLLETRLMSYLDRRLAVIEQAQRELLVLLKTSPAAGTSVLFREEPAASALRAPAVTTGETIPDSTVKGAIPDSASFVPAAAGTIGTAPETTVETAPIFTVPTVVEVERAILDTGLLRTVSIMFEFNKATLLPASSEMLDVLETVLTKYPEVRIEVAGHTDSSGPEEYNLHLSRLRAEAVVEYLLRTHAIDPGRLIARGYGETRPMANNNTPTGRAMNRRVEFVVVRTVSTEDQ